MHKRNSHMVATTIETVDGWTRMVYHNTCVAKFHAETRKVVLNHGGYQTVTTKKRMNQFAKMFDLGYRVFQVKGEWFVQGILPKGNFMTQNISNCQLEFKA